MRLRLTLGGLVLTGLLVHTGLFALPAAEELRVALGSTEITPPLGSPMAGYAAREGEAEGVHDPLMAQVIVLSDGDSQLALITFDLRRIVSPRIVEGVKALGIEHVVLASSHTHSGPDADRDDFPGGGSSWRRETEDRVIRMVREAMPLSFPARVAVGRGETYIGHNRRWVENGEVTMLWRNAEERPTHPLDPGVGVVRIEDAEGQLRAVLVHYACHAVVLGPDNHSLSADWPGAMRRQLAGLLREASGSEVEIFFLQGAAGDINPYRDKQPVAEGGFEEAERVGRQIAEEAQQVLRRLEGEPTPRELDVRSARLVVEDRWQDRVSHTLHVHTVRLGGDLGLVLLPGELFVEHQLTLAARSPLETTLLVGYATSGEAWPGYIPTLEAAVEGGYGADYNTHLEPGAGELLVDRAVIELYRSIGRLETPETGPVRSYD